MAKRLGLSLLLGGMLLLAAGSAGAGSSTTATGTAQAFAIRVVVPGGQASESGAVSAPPYHAWFGQGFAYPSDGSAVSTGSLATSATSDSGTTASANASAEVHSLSLFGGEITADLVAGKATGATHGRTAEGSVTGSTVAGLVVLGQAAAVGANARVPLADWGYLVTLEESSATTTGAGRIQTFHGVATALDIHLTAAHGGLPAGSQIQVGYADATVKGAAAAKQKPPPPARKQKKTPKPPEPTQRQPGTGAIPPLQLPLGLHPQLTAPPYVFPVYGPVSFTDTFGGFRGDVPGNWHHGDDIFAPLGAPILACADGMVFSVGWNDVGGNRLWLRDSEGNEFYYAHLSAFSPLARNGFEVKAGSVLGFVGNTGDAQGTPTHLHFEVHPASLIFMGYDGAVDPTTYLDEWNHLQNVRFQNIAGWVPAEGVTDRAPKPAAILLQVSDISEASGLEPGSLQRAIEPQARDSGGESLLRPLGFVPPGTAGSDRGSP